MMHAVAPSSADPFPLLGNIQKNKPFLLDLSDQTNIAPELLADQDAMQRYVEQQYFPQYQWGIAGYLENRSLLLKKFPQMQNERRFIHLGADILAPLHTALHAPVEGIVYESAYEEGEGNYGGYVVLEHVLGDKTFFSMYGHLDTSMLPKKTQHISRGEIFARMGDMDCNGHWFIHTHVQLLTPRAVQEGWIHRGYCTAEQVASMDEYCPSPYPFVGYTQRGTP